MYEAHFGLKELPYSIGPDPRFLFLAPQHHEVLSKCRYMITHRVGPMYVTGPIGTGKTTIARRIYQELADEPAAQVAMLIAPNLKSANAFLRTIMDELEVPTGRSYDRSLANISEYLLAQGQAGKNVVLLVDEAQNLRRDMLKLIHYLLNYETNTKKLLQIVLFGQLELAGHIEAFAELKSRMFPSALAALSRQQTEEMVGWRFQVAGGKKHPFTAEAFDEIYRHSLGLPREICKLCHLALLKAFSEQAQVVTPGMVLAAAEELRLEATEEEKDEGADDRGPLEVAVGR